MRDSVSSLLDDHLTQSGDLAFAQMRGLRTVRWSYAALAQTAYRFARELEARQIGRGDRVLLWAENSAEWVAAFFGCVLRGAVIVPLDEQSAPDFATRVQQQVTARLLLCGAEQQRQFQADLPQLRLADLPEAIAHHSAARYEAQSSNDDLVEIIFTSGTTAEPKGVCLTHRNLLANLNPLAEEIEQYRRYERWVHPLRFLCLLPLSHVFGQFMGMFVPRLLGGEVFFQASHNPSDIIATIKRERISVASVVPRQLETLRDKLERDFAARGALPDFQQRFARAEGKHFLHRWWMFRDLHRQFGWKFWAFVSGGATLNTEVETFWQRLSFAVVQGYGMTETASLVSVNHPFKLSRGSIGKTLPGQEVKLNEQGEILVRGANVAAGYWRDGVQPLPGAEGWLRTGDVGALDAEGNLFFKGRQKDVIVTAAGLNLYPEDLEAALNQQPEVRASCVVGIEGAQGPEPVAVLILRDVSPEAQRDATNILARANALLNESQRLRRCFVWPEADFPRTATQKVRKPLVKEFVLAQTTATASSTAPASPLAHILASLGSSDLRQLDSLGRVALLSALEDRYQIELDEAALTPATTVNELEAMIRSRADASATVSETSVPYPYPKWALRWPVTWLRVLAYHLLIVPFVSVMCWPRVRGQQRLRDLRGPVLFIANHISMVDPAMILFALPGYYRRHLAVAMAGERLRALQQRKDGANWLSRLFDPLKYLLVVTVFNVFPLPQKSGFRRSFAYAGEAVERGYSVLVFPEGRTTDDGEMKPFMSGIGLLAENLGLTVVPMKIAGLFDLTAQRRYFSRPGTVTITFGAPVSFVPDSAPGQITAELERLVREL
ncbi:MAG: AMP-binding protein [Acidobacteriota bacterium]